jgi:FkbM family methyltransferase
MLAVEIAQGVQICLPPQLSHISTYVFLEQENWLEDEAGFVVSTAEAGGRMLDIGSSFGYYALNYAKAAGPGSRVWAFEPTPAVCELFLESIRLNRLEQITLLRTAVGAESGSCRFLLDESSELSRVDAQSGTVEVAMASLDDLAAEHEFGVIDFVKMDVEGHETSVIQGGRGFFARQSPLVMLEIKAGNAVDYTAAAMLEELGYSLYRLVPELGVLTPFVKDQPDPYQLNIFACKADRGERLAERGLLRNVTMNAETVAGVPEVAAAIKAIPALAPHTAFFEAWLANAPAQDPYLSLLRHAVTANNPALAVSVRCAALENAARLARTIISGPASLAQCLTAARILRGWGDRGLAVSVLNKILPPILQGAELNIDAPFLPPLASYDKWEADTGNWIKASVIESSALWSSFSSYWGEPTQTSPAELLARFGRQTPLLERRRQLRGIIQGQQVGPRPHPLLASKSPENLNPRLWCG